MKATQKKIYLALIAVGAGGLLYAGWRLFWFLCDDAFIAFRYVSNSLLGYGYVWNPPPFMAVEGYTSFLWVITLDSIWRLTGLEPPEVANWLSLLFSALTLLVIGWAVLNLRLSESLRRFRLLFLALVLLGTLTNRTFLAWTSSGLETALFNFILTSWIVMAVMIRERGRAWLFGLTGLAALAHLTRPDGLLIMASTVLIAGIWFRGRTRRGRSVISDILVLTPLIIPLVHLLWRRATYGEWLPNTYYAKYVSPWPESGARYLASFVLEYALWIWMAVLILVVIKLWIERQTVLSNKPNETKKQSVWLTIVVVTVIAHVSYYTFIIGGDHFEYRVYSYLIPLFFLSMLWMLNRIMIDPVIVSCLIGLFIIVSWPIPWSHWAHTQDRWTESETRKMFVPVSAEFPAGTQWYAKTFDHLQAWLIDHSVCARHQAHKAFVVRQLQRYPSRSVDNSEDYPLLVISAVGVAGWTLPDVAIIDVLGLNDYVIARSEVLPDRKRTMAHERTPPPGYLESYPVSCTFFESGGIGIIELDTKLTAQEIIDNETYWRDLIVSGKNPDIPARTLMRQGEFEARNKRYAAAVPYLQRALAKDPDLCGAYAMLAVCRIQMGQRDSALALIVRLPDMSLCSPLALTRLGRITLSAGYEQSGDEASTATRDLSRGQELLAQALEIDSTRIDALVSMASVTLFRGFPDSSEIFLARLETLNNLPEEPLQMLAERYLAKNQPDLARRASALADQ